MNQLVENIIYVWTEHSVENKAAREGKQYSSDRWQQSKPKSESTHDV
jgi:hypothetical protein